MAQDIVNKLQSLSYTSKDFNSIYPELLNTVKQLTYKWDPTISNESDPGVLLLKLNAIIADKCNYNIDTAVLECFPLSVTQQRNARQLFEQLGYYMHWYLSATTEVTLRWNGNADVEANKKEYTIPAFSMVCDADSSIIYTLIGPSDGVVGNDFIVANQKLYTTREGVTFKAIQGVAVEYNINGSTLITPNMLDNNNRLYFPTSDIAENGIFIKNYGLNNYSSWIKKDNLLVESVSENNRFYKFGISQDTSTCYLEFPDNAEEIFKDGIYITYIKTDGRNGNIQYNALEKFYVNITPIEDTNLILSSDNVTICNYINGSGGDDFESINDAYKGYKSTVGTFNTLVTIRDYINACLNSGLVSNCFVCDRYNDIQSTYDIMSQVDGIDQHITHIDSTTKEYKEYFYQNLIEDDEPSDWDVNQDKYYKLESGNLVPKENDDYYAPGEFFEKKASGKPAYTETIPDLTAFSLKLYLLQYSNLNTVYTDNLYENFNYTFDMMNNNQSYIVKSYIEDMKMISHDYVNILPKTTDKSHFCFFKNKYPLSIKITPQYELTEEAKKEIKQNIQLELFKAFNSQELEFGEEISRDLVIKTVENADGRIKNVNLGNINYFTYAVCWKDGENGLDGYFYETDISSLMRNPFTVTYILNGEEITDGGLYFNNIREDLLMPKVKYKYDAIEVKRYIKYSEPITTEPDDWDNSFSLYYTKDTHDNYTIIKAENTTYEPNKYYILKNNTYHKVMYEQAPSDWGVMRGTVKYYEKNSDGVFVGVSWEIPEFPETEAVYKREDTFSVNDIFDIPYGEIEEDYGLIGINSYDMLDITDFTVTPAESMQFRDEIYTKSILNGSTQFFIEDEEYDYRLDQKYDELINGIDKIETNLTVNLGNNNGESNVYELRKNEGIQIFSPNLIGNTVYSNYVKFQFYSESDKVLNANCDYEIRPGEFIAFYWKEDLDNDSVYEFYIYGPGCVINPSFDIYFQKGTSTASEEIVRNRKFDIDGDISYMSPNSNGSRSLNFSESNSVANIVYSDNILSGTKQIVSKRINRISLDTTKYCYWILNELKPSELGSGSGYYELFEKDGLDRYTLKSNEYFIYTNESMSEMIILGNGTTITRDLSKNRESWRCFPVSMEKITEEGISALFNYWQRVKSEIEIVENKFVSLSSGLKFKMEINQESGTSQFKCDGEHTYKLYKLLTAQPEDWDDGGCTNYYLKNSDGEFEQISDPSTPWVPSVFYARSVREEYDAETEYMVHFEVEGAQKFKSAVNYKSGIYTFKKLNGAWVINFGGEKIVVGMSLDKYGITIGNIEDNYDLCEFYVEYNLNWSATIVSKSSSGKTVSFIPESLTMADFKLYYSSGVDVNSDWIEIGGVNLISNGLNMYTQLSLNVSPTDEQILLSNQQVKLVTNASEEIVIDGYDIDDTLTNYNFYGSVIRSSKPINILGGENTYTVRSYDNLLNYIYPSIYKYSKIIPKSDDLVYNDNGEISCIFNPNSSTESSSKAIYFNVPDGEYIIPIKVPNLYGADDVVCALDNSRIGFIYEDVPQGIVNKSGKFYLYINLNSQTVSNEHVLSVTLNGNNIKNVTVTLCNLYKFNYPDNISDFIYIDPDDDRTVDGVDESHYVSDTKMNYFIDKIKNKIKEFDSEHVYNYTYVVPEDNEISNPLLPQSFFNENHVFNDFVIAMYEKESYDLGYISVG